MSAFVVGEPPSETNPLPIKNVDPLLVKTVELPIGSVYQSPDGRRPHFVTNMGALFSDDFGGSAIDANRWDVLDGGLPANPDLGNGQRTQGAIGTGTTGISHSVASSILTVNMGTTNGAEKWFLSKQIFAGTEDVTVLLNKSQAIAANSIFIGLVEVDVATGIPLLNPNLALDFTNRGGVDFGKTTNNQTAFVEAVSDSSGVVASANSATFAPAAMTTSFETAIEFHAEDTIASSAAIDTVSGKTVNAIRLNSQVPNDSKAYKLLIRFKNVAAPASATTVNILRVLVVDSQETRVEVSSGRGDAVAQKAIAANITNTPNVNLSSALGTGANLIGDVGVQGRSTTNGLTQSKLIAAATTNATLVKGSAGRVLSGSVYNASASTKYLKFFNKATAPVPGTDTPTITIPIPTLGTVYLAQIFNIYGAYFSTGIGYAITGAIADLDTTAVVAGDVVLNLGWM